MRAGEGQAAVGKRGTLTLGCSFAGASTVPTDNPAPSLHSLGLRDEQQARFAHQQRWEGWSAKLQLRVQAGLH